MSDDDDADDDDDETDLGLIISSGILFFLTRRGVSDHSRGRRDLLTISSSAHH